MAYSTIADVRMVAGGERPLRELSDVDNSNAVNAAAVESAIVAADAVIDSYINSRVAVPLQEPIPPVIRQLSAELAVFKLRQRRRNLLTETDVAFYDRLLDQVKALASGSQTFGVYPEPTKSELLQYEASDRPSDKAVSRENLKGWC